MKTKGQRQSTNVIDTTSSESLKKRHNSVSEKQYKAYIEDPVRRKEAAVGAQTVRGRSAVKLRQKESLKDTKPTPHDTFNSEMRMKYRPTGALDLRTSKDPKPKSFIKMKTTDKLKTNRYNY